jgi:hypothetical protein
MGEKKGKSTRNVRTVLKGGKIKEITAEVWLPFRR